jgi:hypothetical protein
MGKMPFMIDTREEVRGGRGRESEMERMKSLRVGDGMRVVGEVIGGPRRFWGWGCWMKWKRAKGSVWIDGEGEKEDFRLVQESNNRFVTERLKAVGGVVRPVRCW